MHKREKNLTRLEIGDPDVLYANAWAHFMQFLIFHFLTTVSHTEQIVM